MIAKLAVELVLMIKQIGINRDSSIWTLHPKKACLLLAQACHRCEGILALACHLGEQVYFRLSYVVLPVDQLHDKTERFIYSAKQRAIDAINDLSPKLTSLERGYWMADKLRRKSNNK